MTRKKSELVAYAVISANVPNLQYESFTPMSRNPLHKDKLLM